jgi:uncharacterized protein
MNRRSFLQFLGASGVLASLPLDLSAVVKSSALPHLLPSLEDKLLTSEGITSKILLRWGDQINAQQKFGFNNDFIAFHPLSKERGILWVNHEYVHSLFINGPERTKANVEKEKLEVGGSLIEIENKQGDWKVVPHSKFNRRLDANTQIPFAWNHPIAGGKVAVGTFANCAGGQTPWGTILTCEENYDTFYGDRDRKGNWTPSWVGWEKIGQMPPEHYGWVVEVEPKTGKSKKLISLGRCAHECATVTKSSSGKAVVYTGDDANNEHLYKFISDSADSLERGKLYVASLEKGAWISLDINDQPILKEYFKDQTEIQIYAREAAKLVGATPLDRPEDIELDPLTGHVFIALTNNKEKQNYHGSILKIIEKNNNPGSLTFTHETFLTGGKASGFACPDNMVFDQIGNLWFTTDMSGKDVGKGPYEGLGNNGLFVFIRKGAHAGEILRLASAPIDAEFTGPCFSPDFKTLFLSVQHPGEMSPSLDKLTSRWPDGEIPKSCVVTLQGSLLEKITSGKL